MTIVNPSPVLPRSLSPDGARTPPLAVRVRWDAQQLDASLAGGSDPAASEGLRLRAAQLAEPAKREQLARSVNDLLVLAEGGFGGHLPTTRAPVAADRVRSSRRLLLELRGRLYEPGPHSAQGLARVNRLLEDARSPLYIHGKTGDSLPDLLAQALAEL